jgi:alkane 1-monooxygenase
MKDNALKRLPFFLPYLVPLSVIVGYLHNEVWVFQVVVWLYIVVTVLDTLIGLETRNPLAAETAEVSQSVVWRLAIWLWVPAQAAVIVCALMTVTQNLLTTHALFQLTVSVGMIGGMCGVPVAHELMHRAGRLERGLAEILMTLLSYSHFCIEHVHGHHRHVGTARDPATARFGESFYAFYPRVVCGSLISAWRLEMARRHRLGIAALSLRNRMLRYGMTLVVTYAAIGYTFGWLGVAFFAAQSVIGFSILEVINYVEHYGLTRREIAPGRYERVLPRHSWNSSHRISNWFLFNLARHADHHDHAARSYHALRHVDTAPQLPTGYFGMFLLALFPPLWRYVMDSRVEMWRTES